MLGRTLVRIIEKYAGSGKYQAALFNLITKKLDQKKIELQNESTTQQFNQTSVFTHKRYARKNDSNNSK